MENNLYYAPEIEEFYVGFEFEYQNWIDKWIKVTQWTSPNKENLLSFDKYTESDLLRNMNILDQMLKSDKVRVKHLNKEDIESLGWKEEQDEVKYFELDCFKLYWFNSTIISIDKIFKVANKYTSSSQIFRGAIKNKSELIKLMQQLNIN